MADLISNEERLLLTPAEEKLLAALRGAPGELVTFETLLAALSDKATRNSVTVLINRLRGKGYGIENVWGRGYLLAAQGGGA